MSAAENGIQARRGFDNLKLKSSSEDTAHYFRSRTVLQVEGDLSGLPNIATGAVPAEGERGKFISLLTDEGHLDADLYVTPYDEGVLMDVHTDLAGAVTDRLSSLDGGVNIDRTAGGRWRIFGELPDQKAADTPFETIRFADGRRREVGARVFRDAAEPEGMDWRHARKWDGHAMRLGLLPDHRCVLGKKIKPSEAGYHRLLGGHDEGNPEALERRVLPVRVDTYQRGLPEMAGEPLIAGNTQFGTMLDHYGVCGIALVSLAPWRLAIADGERMTCLDEPVVIAWPTWLSSESEGRVGPAAHLI